LLGYCNQAHFLVNCGILDVLAQVSPTNMSAYAPLAAVAQKLLSPAEMGELFKVIGFGKAIDFQLIGFKQGDKRHML
jgi:SAM-dependent MidA family methyltransferase